MSNIRVSHERARGCGYRKEGGLYLVVPEFKGQPCGKLPMPLDRCPCCGAGIKFARGWTWIGGKLLFEKVPCLESGRCGYGCGSCILSKPPEKMGLIWIGEKFYKTTEDWLNEGREMGVSRRIKSIPHGFKLGETWVAVAHVEATRGEGVDKAGDPLYCEGASTHHEFNTHDVCIHCHKKRVKGNPAIFQAFKPSAIEYVVKGNETEEELTKLEERGISLVKVVKIEVTKEEKQQELSLSSGQQPEI